MSLRLDEDGHDVLTRWLSGEPPESDRVLVAEVIRDIAHKTYDELRYYSHTDPADSELTVIQPREGFGIRVRFWAGPDTFSIADIGPVERRAEET